MNKSPVIQWHCNYCNARLNDQPDFDKHASAWTCQQCGRENINPYAEPGNKTTNRKGNGA